MTRASNRTRTSKTTSKSTRTPNAANSAAVSAYSIPFQTGPSLEHIPDDILHEILSHFPVLDCFWDTEFYVVRVLALRVLSQTSRLLRSRCLSMAWRHVQLFGTIIPKYSVVFFKIIGDLTEKSMRALRACPHLLPLIRTVSVILTRYRVNEIVPAVADSLAMLPNLTTIQVVHAHSQMTTMIKNGFEGKQFPSVRRISLPSSAHEIVKCCPNVEQVTCTLGNGSTIIGSLVNGNCHHVRVLKGISAPLSRLVKLIPNLTHISVASKGDMRLLPKFLDLETIEIVVSRRFIAKQHKGLPLREIAASDIEKASKILKEIKNPREKTVIVTRWDAAWEAASFEFDVEEWYMIREVIKV